MPEGPQCSRRHTEGAGQASDQLRRVSQASEQLDSAVLLLLTRPMAVKMLKKGTVATNADSLIGREAVVTEKIDNLRSTGTVQVNGQEWSARSVNPEHVIEKDEIVMVRSIEGVKLIVGKRIDSAEASEA